MERLTDGEAEIMKIFWGCMDDELTLNYILMRLRRIRKDSVTKTEGLLDRLIEKGFIERDECKMESVYRSIIQEQTYLDLIKRRHNGLVNKSSGHSFIFSLVRDEKLSEEDLKELERMLDQRIDEDEL